MKNHPIHHIFRGKPSEVGLQQARISPTRTKHQLATMLSRPHNLRSPYFRKNLAFMQREFPNFMDQMESFGEAAGLPDLPHTYYLHIYHTGFENEGCTALGLHLEDGPLLFSTNDAMSSKEAAELLPGLYLGSFPDARPYSMIGVCSDANIKVSRIVNSAGLMVAPASGHPKYNKVDEPEYLNLYFLPHLLAQHCADCGDVRKFVSQYRISGVKGLTMVVVDASGDMLALEMESANFSIREIYGDYGIEVNFWQAEELAKPARKKVPQFWESGKYYNSVSRLMYFKRHKKALLRCPNAEELIRRLLRTKEPGDFFQEAEMNIGNWSTVYGLILKNRPKQLSFYPPPFREENYLTIPFPVNL